MKRAVIIGAGPAGITAGLELLKKSGEYEVIILEESRRIGGISATVSCEGNRMDLGGHRFFSKNKAVMRWWKEILPLQGKPAFDDKKLGRKVELLKGGPDPETEDRVFLKRQRVSRIYYNQRFFDYPVKMNWNTVKNLGFFTMLQAGCSYLKAVIFRREEKSLEDFYINRFGKKIYSIFFEGYTEKLWGRHPRDISPDWGAQRVKGLSVTAVIKDMLGKMLPVKNRKVETSLIETFYYPKFGPGQMWEEAAKRFLELGGRITFGCKVTGICQKEGHIEKLIFEENGETKELTADVVFSSMPVKDLVGGMNNVPDKLKNIAKGLPYRDFVTVGILTDRLKLRNETNFKTLGDIVPDCWIYVQDRHVKMGRIQIFNNWSPYMVKNPEQTIWIGLEYFCAWGDAMWQMSPERWAAFGRKELIKMGILSKDAPILLSHCEKVKKAYPAYFDTYAGMPDLKKWLNGIDNLYCIGRNGQHRYNNMDHSMLTAMEAVDCLLLGGIGKERIWNVNTEQEYHEERQDHK